MSLCTRITVALFLLAGCTSAADSLVNGADLASDPDVTVGGETVLPDVAHIPDNDIVAQPDHGLDIPPLDAGPDLSGLQCNPGEGCFLDKCTENAQCQSGWCAEHMGEGVCTTACSDECPSGWSCQQVTGQGPDLTYVCVSNHANLCRPCTESANCSGLGNAEDVCVDYGEEGAFCGGSCEVTQDCPWGFSCQEVPTLDGILTQQCVADAGVCPCTAKSVELSLWTDCKIETEAGTCHGKRFCTDEGLAPCNAQTPTAETCNGLDDNCDSDVDEPQLVEGKLHELCDDANPCTNDVCKGEAGCEHVELTQGECVDGNACTVGDHCEEGVCTGLPIACDDANPCTDDMCDGLGGCSAQFNSDPCDDKDPCTVKDTCEQGTCVGFQVECSCQDDQDCAALDDENLCNGTLACDTSKLPYQCVVQDKTIVSCPEPTGTDAICQMAACDPDTGLCSFEPAHEGYACDDGDACTVGDKCVLGQCTAGVGALCNDGNPCTDDSCQPDQGCVHAFNQIMCNDGNPCTTGDQCDQGECVASGSIDCNDGNVCTDDTCDPGQGCMHSPNEEDCDDKNKCTQLDLCMAGVCVGSGAVDCADANPCTSDLCLPEKGCSYLPVAGGCTDQDPCTVNDYCANGQCVPGVSLTCDDANPCTDDTCTQDGVCTFVPNAADCNDANACTKGDKCSAGKCVGPEALLCADDNPCTDDSCDPAQGCVYALNTAPCDDQDICTTGDHCHLGECIYSGTLTCNDGNDCTDDSCQPGVGCTFAFNNAACDDGNECSLGDHCKAGWCVADSYLSCSDDNPCTDDVCDAVLGCVHVNNLATCNDGNACTEGEVCNNGGCGGGGLVVCNDDNICTEDSCDPFWGCVFTGIDGACDDGNKCTKNDFCADSQCQPGTPAVCDDNNVCTQDDCDPEEGCTFVAADGDCTDGDECTESDTCMDGQCAGVTKNCDDGNECTQDGCDKNTGCTNVPVVNGTVCTQNGGLVCSNGQCVNYQPGSLVFSSPGNHTFQLPPGVGSVRVAVVGGGGGGCGSHYGGGGSGWVVAQTVAVNGDMSVTVGSGGNGGVSGTNDAPGAAGSQSAFGSTAAPGGNGCPQYGGGGSGGSGGGGGGNAGGAGAGGSNGSAGQPGASGAGGAGGHFDNLSIFVESALTGGAGGAAGQSSHSGGGGAGGLLINGQGPSAGDGGQSWSGKGGKGYGSGGGAGGYQNNTRPPGGKGANGVVYVEW